MGRGASKAGVSSRSGGGNNAKASVEKETDRLVDDLSSAMISDDYENPLSNGDMQGIVEVFAERYGLDEDALIDRVRTTAQAKQNIQGVTGYNVTAANGDNMEFYFKKSGDNTFYANKIGDMYEPTPNNWTEKQMINRIKSNGGTADKYSNTQLLDKEINRIKDRAEMNTFLNNAYARNKEADQGNKAYRNTKKSRRIARRNS